MIVNVITHLYFEILEACWLSQHQTNIAILDMTVDEIQIEMANREFAEIELLKPFAEKMHVAVSIIDVKITISKQLMMVERINRCLKYVPAENYLLLLLIVD
jgi:methionine synthase II (cobalamin-independent)